MALTDFLLDLDNTNWYEADYISITLPTGSVLTATNHQNDLTIGSPAVTYYATKYGKWSRGTITSERNAVNEVDLTMTCDSTVLFPNSSSTPMFQRSKLFQRSKVTIGTIYMDLNEEIQGTTVDFTGLITMPSVESSLVTFKCADYLYQTQAAWPRGIIQASCPYSVFDPRGGLNRADYAVTRSVLSGSTQTSLVVSALGSVGNDSLPYTKGYIVPTSGEAQGWSIGVLTQPDSTHLMLSPFDLPIAIGDTFTLYPGDDGSYATWVNKYSNGANFGGFPYVPGPQTSIVGG